MPNANATLSDWLHYLDNRPQQTSNCSDPASVPTFRGLFAESINVATSLDPADKPRDVGTERAVTQTIQLGLERIKTVADRLDLLPVNVPVITVGGTNGKGSTVTALEAIYTEAAYRVGTYTSPHLLYFNERIRLNQQPAPDDALCQAFNQIEQARESIHLTYFEMATLAALLYFKAMQVDVIVLEVGLGGRLDATTIVDADVAVITTIDFDHEEYLGHTLEAIGFEKAGILKPNQTLVYADFNMPHSVLQRARELQVNTFCLGRDYEFDLKETQFTVSPCEHTSTLDRLSFNGDVHQDRSAFRIEPVSLPRPQIHPNAAAAAVIVVQCLSDRLGRRAALIAQGDVHRKTLPVDALSLQRAMETANIAGRQQIIYDTICTVLDVSHNPQSVRLLAERMKTLMKEKPGGRVHAVFSGLKDKDLCGLIQPMQPWVDAWYAAVLDNPRAAPASMIQDAFSRVCRLTPSFYGSIVEAYQAARDCAQPGDILLVYGSFYVVSPIMLN